MLFFLHNTERYTDLCINVISSKIERNSYLCQNIPVTQRHIPVTSPTYLSHSLTHLSYSTHIPVTCPHSPTYLSHSLTYLSQSQHTCYTASTYLSHANTYLSHSPTYLSNSLTYLSYSHTYLSHSPNIPVTQPVEDQYSVMIRVLTRSPTVNLKKGQFLCYNSMTFSDINRPRHSATQSDHDIPPSSQQLKVPHSKGVLVNFLFSVKQ